MTLYAGRVVVVGSLVCLLTLAACQRDDTPKPTPPPSDLATIQASGAPTTESAPTADRRPPSETLRATAAATPAASPATSTPVRPTPAPLPPSPTVSPLAQAVARQNVGDYAAAIQGYGALLTATPAPADAAEARFRLGQALLLDGQGDAAQQTLSQFVQANPAHPLAPAAWFMLGRLYMDERQWDAAVDAYTRYVQANGPLADYAQNRVGNAHLSAQRPAEAARAYEAALRRSDVTAPVLRAAWNSLGEVRLSQGDTAGAKQAYESALQSATDDEDRAFALAALHQFYTQTGDAAAARDALRRLWTDLPRTDAAYQAAKADLDGGDASLQYGKGLAAYARSDWRRAVDAFNQAADQDPAHPAELHLLAGNAYRRLGLPQKAVFHYDQLIDTHPGDPLIPDAVLGKARTLRAGDPATARSLYGDFLNRYPGHKEADQAALELGRLVEDSEDCSAALAVYRDAADTYATSAGLDARARLGLCQLKSGDRASAQATFQTLAGSQLPERQAQGLYWQAYLAAQTDPARAEALYRQAAAADPDSFYGARAALAIGAPPTPTGADASRAAAEAWLLQRTGKTAGDLAQAEQAVAADPDLRHAAAFFEQGLRDNALKHLRLARARVGDDPLKLYHFARQAHALGGTWIGLNAADSLLASFKEPVAALPPELARLAYPRPYLGLVRDAAARYGVDPALFYAILRQESRFEPTAHSGADARGLAQVLPTTGQSIARAIGWPDFSADDLFKPYVNLEFGAYFLQQQLRRFNGEMWAALAAYNAGPNAVPRWQQAAPDPALQIEAIDYPETATYVRRVTEYWAAYRSLYGEG